MFCPKCRAEYREGFSVCADCDSDLVDELPPGEVRKFTEYVEIMGTYNPADIALIRSILDAENITYYFNAEHFRNVEPLAETVRLMVKIAALPGPHVGGRDRGGVGHFRPAYEKSHG